MRIAISGSHRTGKSTLMAALVEFLPKYTTVDEPYHQMEEEGYRFSDPPSIDDFAAQMQRSIELMAEAGDDVLFDRCPIDFVAYMAVHEDADAVDLNAWLPQVRDAVGSLDLVIFVPVEGRDRIPGTVSDEEESRRAVHEKLQEILVDDPFAFRMEFVEVEGTLQKRVQTVLEYLQRDST
jgi:thymidylate kinase